MGKDRTQRFAAQRIEVGQYRQATNDLGYQSVGLEVLRRDILQQVVLIDLCSCLLRRKTHGLGIHALRDLTLYTVESTSADKEDIFRIDLNHLLLGVLTSPLRRHVDNRAFQHLKQALLYAFSAHIARDRRVLGLTGNLIHLIEEDDTPLRFRYIVVSVLQQAHEQRLHVFAYITRLGQRGSVADSERHLEHLGYRPCEKGLTRTGGTDKKNITLLDLHIIVGNLLQHTFVMVVNGYREETLGVILVDDILVQELLDLLRRRQGLEREPLGIRQFVLRIRHHHAMPGLDALIADKHILFDARVHRWHGTTAETTGIRSIVFGLSH